MCCITLKFCELLKVYHGFMCERGKEGKSSLPPVESELVRLLENTRLGSTALPCTVPLYLTDCCVNWVCICAYIYVYVVSIKSKELVNNFLIRLSCSVCCLFYFQLNDRPRTKTRYFFYSWLTWMLISFKKNQEYPIKKNCWCFQSLEEVTVPRSQSSATLLGQYTFSVFLLDAYRLG